MNDPEEDEVAKEAAMLLAYAKAHNEERETTPADQQGAPAPIATQQPAVVARQRPTTAPTTPPTLQEDLVTALLSELRQSRQERATLLHEVATMRRQLDTIQGTAPVPAWLLEVTSNPRAYDAHNPARQQFNGRLPPEKLHQLQQLKTELGIKTQAGLIEDMTTIYLAVRTKTRR